MKRGGRPRLGAEQRRSSALPPVKVNKAERALIEAKAEAAHLTLSAWQRCAALEHNPPRPLVIPPINQEVWLKLANELQVLRRLKLYFRAEGVAGVAEKLERLEQQLKAVRNQLIGVKT